MQIKKIVALLMAFLLMWTLVGCGQSNDDGDDEPEKRPGSLMTSDEVFRTLGDDYHEYLKPKAGGYGQLVPYIGRMESVYDPMSDDTIELIWWGLCTADGYAVTDAVYTSIEWYALEENEGGVFALREQDVHAMLDGQQDYEDCGWVIAEDGSWMIECGQNGYLYSTANHRIVISEYGFSSWYRLYDYSGKAVGHIEAGDEEELSMTEFSGGYAYVEQWSYELEETVGYYVNRRGERVFSNDFFYGDPFEDGMAVVCLVNGKYGVLNENGTWNIQPEYENITRFSQFFVLFDGVNCRVVDADGNERRYFENTSRVNLVVGKKVLYSAGDEECMRYLDTGKEVLNSKTNHAVMIYDFCGETFLSSHDEEKHVLYLMDYNGKVTGEVSDFGHFAQYDDEYVYVYSHSDSSELRLIRLSDGAECLTTQGYAYETPLEGWYCIDDYQGNFTLQNMDGGERLRFSNTSLLVSEYGGKIYYQTWNDDQLVLMDATRTPIIKLKNK